MVFPWAGLLVGTNEHCNKIVFIVVWKANDSTKYKQWILTCKIQGAPHIGSWAAPACQCSVQMFTWWWMSWCHEKKWSTNKNENLQLEQANQKFSVMIWTYNKYILEQCWRQISQLQCTRPPGKRDFSTKYFKCCCNKNNNCRIN